MKSRDFCVTARLWQPVWAILILNCSQNELWLLSKCSNSLFPFKWNIGKMKKNIQLKHHFVGHFLFQQCWDTVWIGLFDNWQEKDQWDTIMKKLAKLFSFWMEMIFTSDSGPVNVLLASFYFLILQSDLKWWPTKRNELIMIPVPKPKFFERKVPAGQSRNNFFNEICARQSHILRDAIDRVSFFILFSRDK